MKTIKLKDLTHTINTNNIQISFLCENGSLIKKKYVGYKLGESKQLFLNEFKNILK
jgi:hypothetical protein